MNAIKYMIFRITRYKTEREKKEREIESLEKFLRYEQLISVNNLNKL
jgi:hypothetical protein